MRSLQGIELPMRIHYTRILLILHQLRGVGNVLRSHVECAARRQNLDVNELVECMKLE